MTPEELSTLVVDVLRAAASDGRLEIEVPEAVVIERPKNRDHGDWATTAALQLAKQAGRPPREVAEVIAAGLRALPSVDAVDIAGPGFINIRLAAGAAGELARMVVEQAEAFGRSMVNASSRIS